MDSKKKTIFLIIFGIMISVLICFAICMLFKEIKKGSEEFINAKKELILSRAETEKFKKFREIYKELEPDLERIDKLFVDSKVPINLIEFLEKMAQNSELSIKISPASIKTIETDLWNSIGFQIVLVGSFANFSKFLEKIETAPYLIEIQNLALNKLTEGEIIAKESEFAPLSNIRATLLTKVFTK